MATLLEKYALQQDDEFQARVRVAYLEACQAIVADTGRVSEHPYCRAVLRDPMATDWLLPVVFGVSLNPTIVELGNQCTDGDIEYTITTLITNFSVPV
jgi:hypothetical protein